MKIAAYQILAGFVMMVFLNSCSKDNKEPGTCDEKMIAYLGDQVYCSEKRGLYATDNILVKGSYKGNVVYYLLFVCAFCNTIPPQEGYICGKNDKIEKIAIDDFNKNVVPLSILKGCIN